MDTNLFSIISTKDNSSSVFSNRYNASYHSAYGAVQESEHVFINNGIKLFLEKHQQQNTIKILEVGFGTGLNCFLTLIENFKQNKNIEYHGVELHPLSESIINQLNYFNLHKSDYANQFKLIHSCEWNKPNLIQHNFQLLKHHSNIVEFKPSEKFNLIYYDAFAPNHQAELWTKDTFEKIYNLLLDNGILVTYCAQGQMKRNLKEVGFNVKALQGPPGKREMTVAFKI